MPILLLLMFIGFQTSLGVAHELPEPHPLDHHPLGHHQLEQQIQEKQRVRVLSSFYADEFDAEPPQSIESYHLHYISLDNWGVGYIHSALEFEQSRTIFDEQITSQTVVKRSAQFITLSYLWDVNQLFASLTNNLSLQIFWGFLINGNYQVLSFERINTVVTLTSGVTYQVTISDYQIEKFTPQGETFGFIIGYEYGSLELLLGAHRENVRYLDTHINFYFTQEGINVTGSDSGRKTFSGNDAYYNDLYSIGIGVRF